MKVKNTLSIGLLGCLVFGCIHPTVVAQMQSPPSSFQPSNSSFQPAATGSYSPHGSASTGSASTGLSPRGTIGQSDGGFQSPPSNYQPPTASLKTADQSPFGSASSKQINWIDGKQLAQAQQLSKQTSKPIMLHFWNERCAPCLALEKSVFPNPSVVTAINSQFIAVKVNTLETPEIHRTYGVTRWPWDVFIAPDGKKLFDRQSPPNASAYTQQINSVAGMYQSFAKFATTSPSLPKASQQKSTPSAFGQPASQFSNSKTQQTNFTQERVESTWPQQTGMDLASSRTPPNQMPAGNSQQISSRANSPSSAVQNQFYKSPASQTNHFAANNVVANDGQSDNSPVTNSIANPMSSYNSTVSTKTPAVGLGGKCPVTLLKSEKWVDGSKEWGCQHRGKLYFFTSREHRDEFMNSPDQFAPVLAGYDVVEYRETGRLIEGKNSIGIFAGDANSRQVYRFASKENMQKFKNDSGRYNDAVRTAMKTVDSPVYR